VTTSSSRSHLLGDLDELVVTEVVEVLRAVDAIEDAGHEVATGYAVRVRMKSVICSRSAAPAGAASRRDPRAAP